MVEAFAGRPSPKTVAGAEVEVVDAIGSVGLDRDEGDRLAGQAERANSCPSGSRSVNHGLEVET